jgi:hypothetical protein
MQKHSTTTYLLAVTWGALALDKGTHFAASGGTLDGLVTISFVIACPANLIQAARLQERGR